MIISLIGFMGCGKSSVGRRLSELLCCRFMDLDDVIEAYEGRSIPDIFATDGERAFRLMEKRALESVISGSEDTMVLASGGGTVMTPECEDIIHEKTFCVYLRASAETLAGNLSGNASDRPLLAAIPGESEESALRSRISDLLSQRSATYERAAHLIIATDGKSIDDIAEEVIRLMTDR